MSVMSPSIPTQHVPVVPGVGVIPRNASLYVGDLEESVTETDLYNFFRYVGNITSVRVCWDSMYNVSLRYGYVNFSTAQEASQALDVLNYSHLKGKPVRIMISNRDPSSRRSGHANVFTKNLETTIDNKELYDIFVAFGTVLSCKVAVDSKGRSKGHGFVQFEHQDSAERAIEKLNGMLINEKKVYVGLFIPRHQRNQVNGSQKFTNVYVKNLSEKITDEDLKNSFANYGPITSAVVMNDGNGNSKCFGFVNFQNPDDAANVVEKLNGVTKDDKIWYVGKAQSKAEREVELKKKYEYERKLRMEKLQGANLYLKNLDDDIDDEKLNDLFSEFGTITSCKVMLDSKCLSRGSGFVAFSTPEEAQHALNVMNGKMVGRKPLYVAIAQRKEERRAKLQVHFSQRRTPGIIAPVSSSGLPGYPVSPRVAPQQMYFGQGSGMMPHQPLGYGFPQQQLIPGIRPGVHPNFMMPYHQLQRQGEPGQRIEHRRGGNRHNIHQQMSQNNGNQGSRYIQNVRNSIDPSSAHQSNPISMVSLPHDVGVISNGSAEIPWSHQPGATNPLSSALASLNPEQQRQMLGEHIFPMIEQIDRANAGKITGMLLEMDKTEVLHLIESPDALKTKVFEAIDVLRMAHVTSSDAAADQIGSLSLNR